MMSVNMYLITLKTGRIIHATGMLALYDNEIELHNIDDTKFTPLRKNGRGTERDVTTIQTHSLTAKQSRQRRIPGITVFIHVRDSTHLVSIGLEVVQRILTEHRDLGRLTT